MNFFCFIYSHYGTYANENISVAEGTFYQKELRARKCKDGNL